MKSNQKLGEQGMTLVELTFVILLLALLAAIAIPNFIRARTRPSGNACVANLKQIEGAKEQWALENKKTVGTPVDVAAVNSYLKNSAAPQCHADGTYTYNPVGKAPTCSLGNTLGHTI
jgi:prepilin-type N-terminal cleavage/methylation domain-containing protein